MQPNPMDDFVRRQVIPLAYRQLPPADLLARAVTGDTEAFIALLCHKYPLVAGVCRKTLGAAAPAEDIIQDVFVELWRQRDKIRTADAIDGWLRKTARNMARKYL